MGRKNRGPRSSKKQSKRPSTNYEVPSKRYEDEDEKGFGALFNVYATEKLRAKLDSFQNDFAEAIGKYRVVFVDAMAGTGKTTIAVMRGLELLREGKVDRIHYVRFPDKRGQGLGALPGNAGEKTEGYMRPFYKACYKLGLRDEDIEKLKAQKIFELSTDIFMRGDSLDREYLIIDESQNGGIEDLQLVLTRLEITGYGIVIGHSGQMDNKLPTYGPDKWNAFQVYQYHMKKKSFTTSCELKINYRGPISQWADKIGETLKELAEA
jgi:phosphate starvation-inducible protein PhoH